MAWLYGDQAVRFGDYEQSTAKKRTKRECFPSEMEAVVPWKALVDLIEPHYPRTSSKGGLPPYLLETMLRIHLLEQWYDLSDPAMEDALIEVATMRRFAGIALIPSAAAAWATSLRCPFTLRSSHPYTHTNLEPRIGGEQ